MGKHAKGTLTKVRRVQELISKANGLPSPGSKEIDGRLQNFCPTCGKTTVSGPPWTCSSCGWDAARDGGPCMRVNRIRKSGDEYAVSIDGLDDDNPRYTAESKKDAKDAKDAAVEVDPGTLGEEVEDKE